MSFTCLEPYAYALCIPTQPCIVLVCDMVLHFITAFVMKTLGKLSKTTLESSSVCNRGGRDLPISPHWIKFTKPVDPLSSELSL